MNDIDRLLRAHGAESKIEPAADGWARLADRAATSSEGPESDPAPGEVDRRRAPRLIWVAAAAILVAVAAVAVVNRDGREAVVTESGTDSVPVAEGESEPTVDPGGEDTGVVDPNPPAADPSGEGGHRPERFVVIADIDGDGLADLGRVEQPVTRSALSAEPNLLVGSSPVPEAEGSSLAVNRADVGPDGTVYYETCCEPAVGEIRAIDLNGGGDRYVTAGEAPAVSPDGSHLAVARQGVGVVVVPVAVGSSAEHVLGDPEGWLEGGVVRRLAWSPDGSTLAAEVVWYGDAGVITNTEVLLNSTDGSPWRIVADDAGVGVALPAFLADGRLAVGVDLAFDETGLSASGLAVIDLRDGRREARISSLPGLGRLEIRSLDATSDGRWLVASSGANVRAFGADLDDAGPLAELGAAAVSVAW